MKIIGFSTDDLKHLSLKQALAIIKLHNEIKSEEIRQLENNKNKVKQASQKDINDLFS